MAALDGDLRDFGIRVQAGDATMAKADLLLQSVATHPEFEVRLANEVYKSAKPELLLSALVYTGQLMARKQDQGQSSGKDVCKRVLSELSEGFS